MEEIKDLAITEEGILNISNINVGCKFVVIDDDVDKAWAEFISNYNALKYPIEN